MRVAAGRASVAAAKQDISLPERQIAETVLRDQDGQVSGIDIKGLMLAVAKEGADRPIRTPYASGYRHDESVDVEAVVSPTPSVLSAQAWIEDDEPDLEDVEAERLAPSPNPRSYLGFMKRVALAVICGFLTTLAVFLAISGIGPIVRSF